VSAIHWFRRDLRRADNPALLEAIRLGGGETVALFVIDPALWGPAGDVRRWWLLRSLKALDASLDGRLLLRVGDPIDVVPKVAREFAAATVHVGADFGPYGIRRDSAVAAALLRGGAELIRTGSAYAASPGRVTKSDGSPYAVFTPFFKSWLASGWRAPAEDPGARLQLLRATSSSPWPGSPTVPGMKLPEPGEIAAVNRWRDFRTERLNAYPDTRNRPDLTGTSGLSVHLKWGEIHPRTLLADLGDGEGPAAFRRQLAWREFYADILARNPTSARHDLRTNLSGLGTDSGPAADSRLRAWQDGRTGYPLVDAGMRQLLAEGWLHNRVRMVAASFLIKDLHLPWQVGAHHFMATLRDADLANNQHGWQWVAGTGTDAAPYYRVFNPVTQGLRFDPAGDYVRRYIPELRLLAGALVHEPWKAPGGVPVGYPERLVDHAEERQEALRRLAES
jgi:deoxyribodipyrimidine photo-lyase